MGIGTNNSENTVRRTNEYATAGISAGLVVDITAGTAATGAAAVDGIAAYDILEGEEIVICPFGEKRKAISGAAFSDGDLLTSDANGKLITAATEGNTIIAKAAEAATAADETVWVWTTSPSQKGAI